MNFIFKKIQKTTLLTQYDKNDKTFLFICVVTCEIPFREMGPK